MNKDNTPFQSILETPLSVLILAGRRNQSGDPLDEYGGGHKAFIDIDAEPMIERVLSALDETPNIEELLVAAPEDVREKLGQITNRSIRYIDPAGSPSSTVQHGLESASAPGGLLVTTCDHALLTGNIINQFLEQIDARKYDAAAACVTRQTYERAYPETKRTFVRFSDLEFSGANLFWFNKSTAGPLIAFWRRLEDNRKKPAKMASEIGLLTGLRYLIGQLSKDAALKRLYQKTGVRAYLAPLATSEAAIDVDKPEDIELVRAILKGKSSDTKRT